jgi:hypothetical protein
MYIIIDYKWGVCCFVVFFTTKRRRDKKANVMFCVKKYQITHDWSFKPGWIPDSNTSIQANI